MSWFLNDSFGCGYGFDDDRVDRSQWKDKSDAALSRERIAINDFNTRFMTLANEAKVFPFTVDNLVHPSNHLTDACWRTFKQIVLSKGCTTKRRVISQVEKNALKSKARNGKMYSISVTAPVHPGQALEKLREKKEKTEAAKAEKERNEKIKAEKAKLEAEKRAKVEAEMKSSVEREYAQVVQIVSANSEDIGNCDSKKRPSGDMEKPEDEGAENNALASSSKKIKYIFAAPTDRMLRYADEVHAKRLRSIQVENQSEKARERKKLLDDLDARMKNKEEAEVEKAVEYRDSLKRVIEQKVVPEGSTAVQGVHLVH